MLMIKKYFNKKYIHILFVALLPIFFYIGVRLLVNENPYPICIFKILTGHNCWGCGITRAFNALFQLQFERAFEFNPRIVIVAPLMFWIWISTLISTIRTTEFQSSSETESTSK